MQLIKKTLCLLVLALAASTWAKGQDFAVKTNLLYDATATVNAGIELGLAPHWTFDLSGNYNAWPIGESKWKHWLAQPEFRYWFCDRFSRHFLGFHALGGQFNLANIPNGIHYFGLDLAELTDHRYQGWGAGGGIAYGYAFILGRHWNLELEAGVGYVYLEFDKFQCRDCGRKVGEGHHHYVGPTKAAINLVYVF